jgi:signal transduction histidine kinase
MSAPVRPRLVSSLRWRLSLAISGVVLLCTAVCITGAVLFLQQALTNRARTEMTNTLSGVSGYLRDQRSDLLGAAKLVGSDRQLAVDLRAGNQQALIVHLTPLYADLSVDVMDVVDGRGRFMVRMEDTQTSGDSALSLRGVRQALHGNQSIAVEQDPQYRDAQGGYAFTATLPLRDQTGRIIGAVIVGRQLDSIFAGRISRALSANVNLIAGNRRTGTTVTDSHGLPTTGLPEPASIRQRIATGATSMVQTNEDGQAVLSGLVPLRGDNGRWIGAVEVARPLGPVFDVIKRLSFLLLLLGAIVVILGMLLALYVSRRVTTRLRILEATASRVARMADSDARLGQVLMPGPIDGNDEIASLAHSFNAMIRALDERMAANARLYEAAQARVRELTGLAEIARLLTAGPSVRETMNALGERVCHLSGSSAVAIWLPGEGNIPALYGGHGLPPSYEALTIALLSDASTDFETVAQVALRTGEVARGDLLGELPPGAPAAHAALRAAAHDMGWGQATAVPLRIQDRIVGVLTCYSGVGVSLSPSDQGLLSTIADQVAVAVENARLYVQARDLVALEERQRLARELHDSVSQALYGIVLGVRTARTLLDRDPARAAEPLEYVLTQAEAGITEMRALIFELRPEILESEGLVTALTKHVESLQVRHGVAVHARLGTEPNVPFPVKEALHRIAQEALRNVVRHAHAQSVELSLENTANLITLDIHDDGKGFDPSDGFPGHFGLRTMHERATLLGGTFTIDSSPGKGTHITVKVPYVATTASALTAAPIAS